MLGRLIAILELAAVLRRRLLAWFVRWLCGLPSVLLPPGLLRILLTVLPRRRSVRCVRRLSGYSSVLLRGGLLRIQPSTQRWRRQRL